jgi:CheY-like chemotaxis protein/HPt (histidine-containing phosphotransfer) domain-containing protein
MLRHPAEGLRQSPADRPPVLSGGLKGVRILLAEDGFDNQEVIRAMLRKAGAEVEVAENGRLAVARAQAESFDVILMDMNMPEMDGCEATRTLRDQGYARPILALTANAMSSDKERCLAAGCNDYLVKPIDRTRMIRTIAAHVRNQAVERTAENEGRTEDGGGRAETSEVFETSEVCPGEPDRQRETVVSQFAGDPEMAEILELFVHRLAGQVAAMRESFALGNYEHLQRLAHGLKGSGGSYGYPSLTEACRMLEHAVRAREIEAARAALDWVAAVCQAIQNGYVPCAAAESAMP